LSWTLIRETADRLQAEYGLAPVRSTSVAKADVLAYITEHGDDEILLPPTVYAAS
jgi:hypothetical protein